MKCYINNEMYSINPDANFTSERDTWEALIIELQEENEIIKATLSLIEVTKKNLLSPRSAIYRGGMAESSITSAILLTTFTQ